MKSRIAGFAVIVTLLIATLTGCSIDRVESLRHPESAKASDTVSTVITNIFAYLNNTRQVTFGPVQRDSVHCLIRVPAGYEILSVKYVLITNFTFKKLFDQLNGKPLSDSLLNSYAASLAPMTRDQSLDTKFKGSIFTAYNNKSRDSTIKVNTNNGTWAGYSAKVDILIKNGELLDTAFAYDSVMKMATGFGVDTAKLKGSSPLPIKIDTVAVTAKPILIQTTFRVKGSAGHDTIFYYTKTAKLPAASQAQSSNGDAGTMMYALFDVLDGASVKNATLKNNLIAMNAFPNPFTKTIRFTCPSGNNSVTFSVYTATGSLVREFSTTGNGFAEWDGTDNHGVKVKAGQYIVRVQGKNISGSQVVNFIR